MSDGTTPLRVLVVQFGGAVRAVRLEQVRSILGPALTARELASGRTNRVIDLRSDRTLDGWGVHLLGGGWRDVVLFDRVIGAGTWVGDSLASLDLPAGFADNQLASASALVDVAMLREPLRTVTAA